MTSRSHHPGSAEEMAGGATMTLTLPASHKIEIVFTLPPDFPHGGIANVPGILMKPGETTRGVPLGGIAVKVMANSFLIGLSSVDADMQRNKEAATHYPPPRSSRLCDDHPRAPCVRGADAGGD
jgi:hypothetical protein